jgi:hypothetical protein
MSRRFFTALWWVFIAAAPVLGQEKLYPVRGRPDVSILLNSDRSAFVVERSFQHKMTLGFPTDDRLSIFPDTRTPLVLFWLRIQNVSQNALEVNTAKFTITDDEGKTYPALAPDEAFKRMMADASEDSLGTKTLRSISLGRVGNKRTEEDVKDDMVRYSLHSGQIAAGSVAEGLIYFEGPRRKKFTVTTNLGDIWSKPLVFSTEKQK